MNRSELKKLSEMRLSDARALFRTRRNYAGAYYIAGYAVECAIKACIARQQGQYPFPPRLREKELSNYYTHDVSVLVETAKLKSALEADCRTNATLQANWSFVVAWNKSFRYETTISRSLAQSLITAIEDPQDGVLVWFKKHW